jgi:predicted dehydrogenase
MRIGLVGYGHGGRNFHMPYIQAATEWDIVGVVTNSSERRAKLQEDAPGTPAFDSLDALIDADVDLVVVSTPPATRRELVLRALSRGVNVVADKPFGPDLEGAKELVAAAESAHRVLTVFQNRRFDSDFLTLRRVVNTGQIGTPWRADLVLDQADPGTLEAGPGDGLLRDLGAHTVDQAIQVMGRVARVDAHLDWFTFDDNKTVDVGFALGLHHENGTYSAVSASKLGYRDERRMVIYGSEGSYSSNMHDVQVDQFAAGLHPSTCDIWGVEDESRWGTLATANGVSTIKPVAGNYSDYYRNLHAALLNGTQPEVSLDQALHTIAVLDAARESDRVGRTVPVS